MTSSKIISKECMHVSQTLKLFLMKIQNKNLAFSILQKNPKSLHVTSGSDNNMDLITTQYWHKREGS